MVDKIQMYQMDFLNRTYKFFLKSHLCKETLILLFFMTFLKLNFDCLPSNSPQKPLKNINTWYNVPSLLKGLFDKLEGDQSVIEI